VIVVADTTPLLYLILIECDHILPALYGRVIAPRAVISELTHRDAPTVVRAWVASAPVWLHIDSPRQSIVPSVPLGAGEMEAIALTEERHADALLIDDRDGRQEAIRRRLPVLGTLRVLADAAEEKLINLPDALGRQRQTSFRASEELFEWLLSRERRSLE
jgi:predicted nucleic acid-binding protein